jgi:hypothetical protein
MIFMEHSPLIFKGQLSRQGFILPSALIKGQTGTAVEAIKAPPFYSIPGMGRPVKQL